MTVDAFRQLRDFCAYRITEIPRHDAGSPGAPPEENDPGRAQRVAALSAAYHAGIAGNGRPGGAPDGVAFGWLRTAAGGPVQVIAAGDALAGSATPGHDRDRPGCREGRESEGGESEGGESEGGESEGGESEGGESEGCAHRGVLLALPGGARGTVLRPGALPELLGGLPRWREIAGISDALLAPAEEAGWNGRGGQAVRYATPSLDEGLLASWTGPFGWIVIAEPLRPAALRSLAEEVARRQRLAEAAADRFPGQAAQARRLAGRHAELQRGISAGFWRIRVLTGGSDEASAARVAGLFCASVSLDGLPYALSPVSPPGKQDEALPGWPGGDAAPAAPFCGSTELLAALARPPRSEIPGLRLALRPDFDVTPEVTGSAIHLGDILDRNRMPAGPFMLPLESLNRHVFVCGATGAGKSQTVRSLLEAAARHRVRWLVVEPAKAEYRLMACRMSEADGADGAEVVRIRLGEADAIAAGLNPLEPAAGASGARFPLQTHADLVKALFIAAFRSEEPFPQVLSAALTRVYEEAGWDLPLGEPAGLTAAYPGLTDLQRAAEQVVHEIGYSQRVTDDVLGFIRVRLSSLRQGTTGRFLEGGHQIDFGKLLRKNVVLEIEDVGDDRDKAFLMGTVLIRLAEHLRLTHRALVPPLAGGSILRHLTVIEEAHRLLRRPEAAEASGTGAAGYAVEMFAGLLAEIRAYGEGLVIAEQIPARLLCDVIKNTAVKITHRLPAADDREAVGATMNATHEQSRYLVTLPPGQAAVCTDGMDFPVLVKIKDGSEREVAAVPRTADARSVVSPRSATCGAECAARPCTLRDMRGAQRVLDDLPWIRMWAELTVLAHLSGWPMPVPTPARIAQFRQLPARLSQCAVSHAADAAAAARSSAIRSAVNCAVNPAVNPAVNCAVNPAALAAHACAAIGARAGRDQWLCAPDEPQWRLPGPVTEAIAFGATRPSAIETALARVAGGFGAARPPAGKSSVPGAAGAEPLTALLGAFVDCGWPVPYLRPTAPPAPAPAPVTGPRAPSPTAG